MKKTMGICLFAVLLAICVYGGVMILNNVEERGKNQLEIADANEKSTEDEQTELAESMQVQQAYRYLLKEKDGLLVVYEKDGETVLLETNIGLQGLDEETRKLLQEGIKVTDEKELYDLLESYSS